MIYVIERAPDTFEELCVAAKGMGIKSIELVDPQDWPTLKKHGLTSALPQGAIPDADEISLSSLAP